MPWSILMFRIYRTLDAGEVEARPSCPETNCQHRLAPGKLLAQEGALPPVQHPSWNREICCLASPALQAHHRALRI